MFQYLYAGFQSPALLIMTAAYFTAASVTTFDTRMIQAKRRGEFVEEPDLPRWVALFYWVEWGLLIAILILNWRFGLALWLVKFILKILPVLETVGNVLMSPFKPRRVLQTSAPTAGAHIPQTEAEYEELRDSLRKRLGRDGKDGE